MTSYIYYNCCVNWPREDVFVPGGLSEMIENAKEIKGKTFTKNVDKNSFKYLRYELGYAEHWRRGLTMSKDWHINYFRGMLHGSRVYFFTHSAIEYVFKKGHEHEKKNI